jgi:hypothetical protein
LLRACSRPAVTTNMPTRDAVMLWRKTLRRADKETKKLLLSMLRQVGKGNRRRTVKVATPLSAASPVRCTCAVGSVWFGSVADLSSAHRLGPFSASCRPQLLIRLHRFMGAATEPIDPEWRPQAPKVSQRVQELRINPSCPR